MPVIPMRKRRHMAVFKVVMAAHAPVLTDATTSGGWIGWMTAKTIPATKAAKPLQRMRLDAVAFILLSFLRGLRFGHLRSRVRLLPPVRQRRRAVGEVAGPGIEGGQVAVLRLHAASASRVTNAS